jgi:hypothetical protein
MPEVDGPSDFVSVPELSLLVVDEEPDIKLGSYSMPREMFLEDQTGRRVASENNVSPEYLDA